GQLERRVERLDHPLVRIPAVVGRSPGMPAVLQLDVTDVQRRKTLDHSGLLPALRRAAMSGSVMTRLTNWLSASFLIRWRSPSSPRASRKAKTVVAAAPGNGGAGAPRA